MKPISLTDAAGVIEARCDHPLVGKNIEGVSIDSREALTGKAFFAIKGQNFDGHDFVRQAFDKGCALAVVNLDYHTPHEIEDKCILKVKDTLTAFQELAKYYLGTLHVLKAAVTGSVGKTTTRELMHAIFSMKYKTLRNIKNFNNDIGVPLTIFRIEEEHEAVIFEMGMDHVGEIHKLADMVRPDFAVITKIGVAHIDNLGSREGILGAKWEITDFFHDKSAMIINSDDDLLCAKAKEASAFRIITAGQSRDSDFQIDKIRNLGAEGITFTITHKAKQIPCRLNVPGEHNAGNAALAVAAGVLAGIPVEQAAEGILSMRMEDKRLTIKPGRKNIKIIDDTYNANTDSMIAGLKVLKDMEGRRKTAILGDMLGLGSFAPAGHRSVGEMAAGLGIDQVLAVGTHAAHICEGVKAAGGKTQSLYFESKEQLFLHLDALILEEDVVLVKGSRGMEMEQVVQYLESNG